jgi:hypothetical protein
MISRLPPAIAAMMTPSNPAPCFADDAFHLGPDLARLLAGLDAEFYKSEFGFMRDIGRTSHDRPADRSECRYRFGARPA